MPRNEMLAAPSRKATQPRAGGRGRSSGAITSHNTSNAGAIAAAPITVGRDSSSSIERNFTYRVENGRKLSALQETSRSFCRAPPEANQKPWHRSGSFVAIFLYPRDDTEYTLNQTGDIRRARLSNRGRCRAAWR